MNSGSYYAPRGGGGAGGGWAGGPPAFRSAYDYQPPPAQQQQQHNRDRSRSPVRWDASRGGGDTRRGGAGGQHSQIRSRIPEEPQGWEHSDVTRLDLYNSDLWLMIEPDGFNGRPLSEGGFVSMWAGGQATQAACRGRVYYEVRVGAHNRDATSASAQEDDRLTFLLRCGWSRLGAGMVLGEEPLSYGYGGTGKASTRAQFKEYGAKFDSGDVIGCYLEYRDDEVPVISYTLNGCDLGVCYTATEARRTPLFPHLLSKNVQFEVNFGQRKPWYPPPDTSWIPISHLPVGDRLRNYLPPGKREDCTIVMMCGLPACGKTVWAEKFNQEHPDSRYCILGTNSIIDRFKVMGLPRQRNYHGRWEMLIERATKCLNALFEVACSRKRNYILDQTNVYASAQRRKMAPFDAYRRIAVVIVPTDPEYQRRLDQQRRLEGKEVPDQAIATMKANFSIPSSGGGLFDEIIFPELPRDEAERLVARYNRESVGQGGGQQPQQRQQGQNSQHEEVKPDSNYDGGWQHQHQHQYQPDTKPQSSYDRPWQQHQQQHLHQQHYQHHQQHYQHHQQHYQQHHQQHHQQQHYQQQQQHQHYQQQHYQQHHQQHHQQQHHQQQQQHQHYQQQQHQLQQQQTQFQSAAAPSQKYQPPQPGGGFERRY